MGKRNKKSDEAPVKADAKAHLSARSAAVPKRVSSRARLVDGRLEQVLSTSADVFIEFGFDKANYNEICRRASISKASLYDRFPTKEQLFLTVLEHRMQSLAKRMSMEEIDRSIPVANALTDFGDGLLSSVLSDAQIELIRTISTVSSRLPELGGRFFSLGPVPARRSMERFLRDKILSGDLRDTDPPELMTGLFITLVVDSYLFRKLLGVAHSLTVKQRKQQVARAVDVFMRLYAPVRVQMDR